MSATGLVTSVVVVEVVVMEGWGGVAMNRVSDGVHSMYVGGDGGGGSGDDGGGGCSGEPCKSSSTH